MAHGVFLSALSIGHVTTYSYFDRFLPSLDFRVRAIAIADVHHFEFITVDSDNGIREQIKLLARDDELTTYIAERLTVVSSEVCDRLKVKFKLPVKHIDGRQVGLFSPTARARIRARQGQADLQTNPPPELDCLRRYSRPVARGVLWTNHG